MSAFRSHFLISPETAVRKFLVDMRLAAERSCQAWKQALADGFARTALTPADRAALLNPHPLDDYFYAGLIGLQAAAVRERFTSTAAEALLRQVALQADDAAGRDDRMVSNMVFIILGRIRRNIDVGLTVPSEDVVTDVLLERLSIDRMAATRHLMHTPCYRHALMAPLTARPIWWEAFRDLYMVAVSPRAEPRRAHATERAETRLLTRILRSPAPPLPILAVKLGAWLTPRPHTH